MTLARNRLRFWIVIGVGLPVLAFLQAWTASALVRATLRSEENQSPFRVHDATSPAPSRAPGDTLPEHDKLDSAPVRVDKRPKPVATPGPQARIHPLRVPRCEGVRVVATSQSSDPLESVAVVQAANEPRGFVRRVGNSVGRRRVAFIGRNPVEWSPAVWLSGTDGLCQAVLFDQPPEPAKPSPAQRLSTPTTLTPNRTSRALDPAIVRGVSTLGAGTFRVERSAVESILERTTELLRSLKIRRARTDGKVVGFELRRVAPGTSLDVLGLKNGDVIQSINGFELTGPAQALQAYARLRAADNIHVKALRNGVPIELEYRIR